MYQFEPHHVYIEKGLPYPLDTHQPEFEDEPYPGGEGGGYSYILNITQIESALSCTYLTLPESLNPFAKGLLSIFNRVI